MTLGCGLGFGGSDAPAADDASVGTLPRLRAVDHSVPLPHATVPGQAAVQLRRHAVRETIGNRHEMM